MNNPPLCKYCKKPIPSLKVHQEVCPDQRVMNGIRLSHGLEVLDYTRLLLEAPDKPQP